MTPDMENMIGDIQQPLWYTSYLNGLVGEETTSSGALKMKASQELFLGMYHLCAPETPPMLWNVHC